MIFNTESFRRQRSMKSRWHIARSFLITVIIVLLGVALVGRRARVTLDRVLTTARLNLSRSVQPSDGAVVEYNRLSSEGTRLAVETDRLSDERSTIASFHEIDTEHPRGRGESDQRVVANPRRACGELPGVADAHLAAEFSGTSVTVKNLRRVIPGKLLLPIMLGPDGIVRAASPYFCGDEGPLGSEIPVPVGSGRTMFTNQEDEGSLNSRARESDATREPEFEVPMANEKPAAGERGASVRVLDGAAFTTASGEFLFNSLRGTADDLPEIHQAQTSASFAPIRHLSLTTLAVVYLLAIVVAESITTMASPFVGTMLHMSIFAVSLLHAALDRRKLAFGLLLTLALVPLTRVVSLGLPLGEFGQEWWYVVTSIPLLAASIAAARALWYSRHQIGLCLPTRGTWLLTIAVAASGLLIGVIEHRLLSPPILATDRSLEGALFFSAALLVGTGISEEVIYRGLLQTAAVASLGLTSGILYSAILFAVMHLGHASIVHTLFVFGVAIGFGYARHRTGSLLSVIVAHTVTNVMFFIVLPHWQFPGV